MAEQVHIDDIEAEKAALALQLALPPTKIIEGPADVAAAELAMFEAAKLEKAMKEEQLKQEDEALTRAKKRDSIERDPNPCGVGKLVRFVNHSKKFEIATILESAEGGEDAHGDDLPPVLKLEVKGKHPNDKYIVENVTYGNIKKLEPNTYLLGN